MNRKRIGIGFVLVLVLILIFVIARESEPPVEMELLSYVDDGTELVIEGPAPGFELTSLEGQTVSLEEFRGKIVLLTYFTST